MNKIDKHPQNQRTNQPCFEGDRGNYNAVRLKTITLLLLALPFNACQPEKIPPQPSFYYWKTELSLSLTLQKYIEQTNAQALFIKFADIGLSETTGEAEPYALLRVRDTTGLSRRTIVPCFFITEAVFRDAAPTLPDWLSDRVLETLESVGGQFGREKKAWPEIQFDCDWTAGSRVAFFVFLEKMQKKLPKTVFNTTIRLHQYKNPDATGVPPTERGTLMCYNTGNLDNPSAGNSIFSLEDALPYQTARPYPLPLDLALPVFSWAPIYRDGAFWRIWPEPDAFTMGDTTKFRSENGFLVSQKAQFIGGHYLRRSDQLRVETCTSAMLESGQDFFRAIKLAPDARVLYFSLEEASVDRFDAVFLRQFTTDLSVN